MSGVSAPILETTHTVFFGRTLPGILTKMPEYCFNVPPSKYLRQLKQFFRTHHNGDDRPFLSSCSKKLAALEKVWHTPISALGGVDFA